MATLSIESFLRHLPRRSEIPRVEQAQLRRLYEKFSKGIEDEELLAEVESRILARAEVFIDLNDLEDALRFMENFPIEAEETYPGGILKLSRTGQQIVVGDADLDYQDIRNVLGNYAMQFSDAWGDISMAYEMWLGVRGKSFKRRMIALDTLINTTHMAGSEFGLADSFIESRPLSTDKFLDRLTGIVGPSISKRDVSTISVMYGRPVKRPEVHVHSYRRRR